MQKKKLVILTGAGMSAESGIRTFRDSGGLWEEHDVMDVASIDGWHRNPKLVLEFYNARRAQLVDVEPNKGHFLLAELEASFDVSVVTQNVDNLHERAGSTHVVHLHGELTKVHPVGNDKDVLDIGTDAISLGDLGADGSQLRPHIVWFGESVPAFEDAAILARSADILAVVGTSLNVYPAAGLLQYAPKGCPIFLIDPHPVSVGMAVTIIAQPATTGVAELKSILLESYM